MHHGFLGMSPQADSLLCILLIVGFILYHKWK
jgi:hypothetical protein